MLKQESLKVWYQDQYYFYIHKSSNTKLLADDTSLLSVYNNDSSAAELSSDLAKISHWAQQWKMSFNQILVKKLRRLFSV